MPTNHLRFPTVTGKSLTKRIHHLPNDFVGALNLVLVAFYEHQQAMIDTWLPVAQQLAARHPRLAYYELPTLARYNPVVQWYINEGMRRGIPDESVRAATIVLYLDRRAFRHALGLPAEDTIYALLVDQAGHVLWRTEGRCDDYKADLLAAEIARRQDHGAVLVS